MRKLIIFFAVFVLLIINVSAKTYTKYSETSCVDNQCNALIYPSQEFKNVNGSWERMNETDTWLNTDYFCRINKSLPLDADIECLDYNSTYIKFNIIFNEAGQIPIRYLYNGIENITKRQYININKNQVGRLYEIELDYTALPTLHIGQNSTTLVLENGNGIIGDTFSDSFATNTDYGTCSYLDVFTTYFKSYINWNTSSISSLATIDSAIMTLKLYYNYLDTGESLDVTTSLVYTNYSDNYIEGDACGTAGFGNEMMHNNFPDYTYMKKGVSDQVTVANTDSIDTEFEFNVTSLLLASKLLSENTFAVYINSTINSGSPISGDSISFYSSEYATASYRPKLNITYTLPDLVLNVTSPRNNLTTTGGDTVFLNFTLKRNSAIYQISDITLMNITVNNQLVNISNFSTQYGSQEYRADVNTINSAGTTHNIATMTNTSYAVLLTPSEDTDAVHGNMWNTKTTTSFVSKFEDDTGSNEAITSAYYMVFLYGEKQLSDGIYINCGQGTTDATLKEYDVVFDTEWSNNEYVVILSANDNDDTTACAVENAKTTTGFKIQCDDDTGNNEVELVNWCAISKGEFTYGGIDFRVGEVSGSSTPTATYSTISGDTMVAVVSDQTYSLNSICQGEVSSVSSTSLTLQLQDDAGSTCSSTMGYVVASNGTINFDGLQIEDLKSITTNNYSAKFIAPELSDGVYDVRITLNVSGDIVSNISTNALKYGIVSSPAGQGGSVSVAIDKNSTTNSTIWFNWTTVGNYSYSEVFRAGSLVYNGSNKYFNNTGLTNDTSYSFNITVRWNSTLSNSTTFSITTDETEQYYPPGQGGSVAVTLDKNTTSTSTIWFNWSTTGNYSYSEVFRAGSLVYNGSDKNMTNTGLTNDTSYSFNITVRWNSTLSNSTTFSITTDETEQAYVLPSIFDELWNISSIFINQEATFAANVTHPSNSIDTVIFELKYPNGTKINYTAGNVFIGTGGETVYKFDQAFDTDLTGNQIDDNYGTAADLLDTAFSNYSLENISNSNINDVFIEVKATIYAEPVNEHLYISCLNGSTYSQFKDYAGTGTIHENLTVPSGCYDDESEISIRFISSSVVWQVSFFETDLYVNYTSGSSTDRYEFNLTDTSQTGYYNITRVWANDSAGNENSSYPFSVLLVNSTTDTCTYSSNDWVIEDICTITSKVDVGSNSVVIKSGGGLHIVNTELHLAQLNLSSTGFINISGTSKVNFTQ